MYDRVVIVVILINWNFPSEVEAPLGRQLLFCPGYLEVEVVLVVFQAVLGREVLVYDVEGKLVNLLVLMLLKLLDFIQATAVLDNFTNILYVVF